MFAAHELAQVSFVLGVPAKQAVAVKQPQIASAARRFLGYLRWLIGGILLWIDEITHKYINLRCFKAGELNVESSLGKKGRQLSQLDRECGSIPAGLFSEPIVGEKIRATFGIA